MSNTHEEHGAEHRYPTCSRGYPEVTGNMLDGIALQVQVVERQVSRLAGECIAGILRRRASSHAAKEAS